MRSFDTLDNWHEEFLKQVDHGPVMLSFQTPLVHNSIFFPSIVMSQFHFHHFLCYLMVHYGMVSL